MTIASHELTLTEINNGDRYKMRCEAVHQHRSTQVMRFQNIAYLAARDYEREFGSSPNEHIFTTEDILLCAAELAEYYTNHVAEMNNLKVASQA